MALVSAVLCDPRLRSLHATATDINYIPQVFSLLISWRIGKFSLERTNDSVLNEHYSKNVILFTCYFVVSQCHPRPCFRTRLSQHLFFFMFRIFSFLLGDFLS